MTKRELTTDYEQLTTDYFRPGETVVIQVQTRLKVADNTGATLLEQAEAAGLSPDHGCRMGICHTCTTIRRSGCTRDVRTGELDAEPDTRIRICVNAPVGDVAVDL